MSEDVVERALHRQDLLKCKFYQEGKENCKVCRDKFQCKTIGVPKLVEATEHFISLRTYRAFFETTEEAKQHYDNASPSEFDAVWEIESGDDDTTHIEWHYNDQGSLKWLPIDE